MATSIAKLAILLTTDTSGMTRGFATATQQVTGFAQGISALRGTLAGLAAAFGLIEGSRFILGIANDSEQAQLRLEMLLGSVEKAQRMTTMVQGFGAGLFEDREILNATTKLLAFGKTAEEVPGILQRLGDLAISTDQSLEGLATRAVKSGDSFDKLMAAGQRAAGSMARATDSMSGQWKKLWDNIEDTTRPAASAIGANIAQILASVNTLFLNREQRMDMLFGGPEAGQRIINTLTEVKGLHDDGAKAAKEIADAYERMVRQGESLTKQLRTPAEVFTESIAEAKQLFQSGIITAETYRRAAEDAQRQFDAASRSADRAAATLRGGTPAAVYGTQQGFQQSAEARRQTQLLTEIKNNTAKPAVALPVVNF